MQIQKKVTKKGTSRTFSWSKAELKTLRKGLDAFILSIALQGAESLLEVLKIF